MQHPEIIVPALLEAAGLNPSEQEVAGFIEAYPKMRATADALYAVPGVIYESPTLIFRARV
jgi:hypothetical protein